MELFFVIILLACTLPGIVGLFGTRIAMRLLAGAVRPGLWLLIVLGWAVGSTLAFAAWYYIARIRAGYDNGGKEVFMFMFLNGLLILLVNTLACVVGAMLRLRRRRSAA